MSEGQQFCERVQTALTEAFLARRLSETWGSEAERAHERRCSACTAHGEALAAMGRAMSAEDDPSPSPALVETTRRRAAATLACAPTRAPLPIGYFRELSRLLGGASAALPAIVLWNLAVLSMGGSLLQGFLSPAVLSGLGVAYVLTASGWMALLFGSIPFVAHNQVQRRLREVQT